MTGTAEHIIGRLIALAAAALFALAACVAAWAPDRVMDAVGARMRLASTSPDFAFGLAALLAGFAVAALIEGRFGAPRRAAAVAILAAGAGALWFWTAGYDHWVIDDAGVTFAYARSLAEGAGLTFYPGRPPEEGYSSTLWMLILSAAAWLGLSIPAAAKLLGLAATAAALAAASWVVLRELGARAPFALVALIAASATAPVVVWTASGQEHALQGLLITLAAIAAWRGGTGWPFWMGVALAALVLTRPEAPLLVVAAFVAALGLSRVESGGWGLWRVLPIALIPFLVFLALMTFRLSYFGDPFPNPYYAKAGSSTLSGLINPFGGGWSYVIRGLSETNLLLLLPFALLVGLKNASPARRRLVVIGVALLVAHLAFVVWARGDWMRQFRFLAPIIPLFALLSVIAAAGVARGARRALLLGAIALILVQSTIIDMVGFRGRLTTPMAKVSRVGDAFADLAQRMGIEGATLAHHDAGGIAFDRRIELIDLGGLVDRRIAKDMDDAEALAVYLFDERKPTFIFGARNFAARSGVFERPEFARDYVPLVFETKRFRTTYRHIRRDAVRPAPGVEIQRKGEEVIEVRVR